MKNFFNHIVSKLVKSSGILFLANKNASKPAAHQIILKNKQYDWQGPFQLIKNENHK